MFPCKGQVTQYVINSFTAVLMVEEVCIQDPINGVVLSPHLSLL